MKFNTTEDIKVFLIEINRVDLLSQVTDKFTVTEEMEEIYISGRRSLIPKLKDFRKSQSGKSAWRQNRYKYMKGIKKYHKSTDGKRMHRAMGRFLATRNFKSGIYAREALAATDIREVCETLKAISSLRTHLYIDHEYFMSTDDEIDLSILTEELLPTLSRVENSIIEGHHIHTDDIELLIRVTEPKALIHELSILSNKSYDEVFKLFKLEESLHDLDSTTAYLTILNSVKSQIGVSNV